LKNQTLTNKMYFFLKKIWSVQKMVVSLHQKIVSK
jgi:hypothetical protein